MSNLWGRLNGRWRRTMAGCCARRLATMRNRQPMISFSFDDFPRSALHTAGQILKRRGLAGTYYTSLGLMGQVTPTGEAFQAEDLEYLVKQGHELGCHTFAHCHAWETKPRRFETSIIENRQALKRLLPSAGFQSLSYPISCPRPGTKRRAAKYFAGCRSGGQTFNHGTIDLNHLAAYFLEQSRDKPEAIKEMIDRNCQAGGWLILATHDVCDRPTRFGCTVDLFEKVVSDAVASGAVVLPVAQALAVL